MFGLVFIAVGIFLYRKKYFRRTPGNATLSEPVPLGSKTNDTVVRHDAVAADDGPEVVHEVDTSR